MRLKKSTCLVNMACLIYVITYGIEREVLYER